MDIVGREKQTWEWKVCVKKVKNKNWGITWTSEEIMLPDKEYWLKQCNSS